MKHQMKGCGPTRQQGQGGRKPFLKRRGRADTKALAQSRPSCRARMPHACALDAACGMHTRCANLRGEPPTKLGEREAAPAAPSPPRPQAVRPNRPTRSKEARTAAAHVRKRRSPSARAAVLSIRRSPQRELPTWQRARSGASRTRSVLAGSEDNANRAKQRSGDGVTAHERLAFQPALASWVWVSASCDSPSHDRAQSTPRPWAAPSLAPSDGGPHRDWPSPLNPSEHSPAIRPGSLQLCQWNLERALHPPPSSAHPSEESGADL
eukprot:939724-Pleurochrysis_carterae.AAC.2